VQSTLSNSLTHECEMSYGQGTFMNVRHYQSLIMPHIHERFMKELAYGVATIIRLLKMIGLFCKRDP